MRSEIIPEGDEFRHPLFISPLPFLYRIVYRDTRRSNNIITYSTPHEIILNLHCFRDDDKITYINRENSQEAFTITVDRFKIMMAESIYNVSYDDLELLYMHVIVTRGTKIIETVLKDIMALTKLNYNTSIHGDGKPVTLRFSDTIGNILTATENWKEERRQFISYI